MCVGNFPDACQLLALLKRNAKLTEQEEKERAIADLKKRPNATYGKFAWASYTAAAKSAVTQARACNVSTREMSLHITGALSHIPVLQHALSSHMLLHASDIEALLAILGTADATTLNKAIAEAAAEETAAAAESQRTRRGRGGDKSDTGGPKKDRAPFRKGIICAYCAREGHDEAACFTKQKAAALRVHAPKGGGQANAAVEEGYVAARNDACLHVLRTNSPSPCPPSAGSLTSSHVNKAMDALATIVDSGASAHMLACPNDFVSMEPSSVVVRVGDGRTLTAVGRGTARIRVTGDKLLVLRDALLVPALAHDLISVAALARDGATVVFGSGGCTMRQGERVMHLARAEGGLYRVAKGRVTAFDGAPTAAHLEENIEEALRVASIHSRAARNEVAQLLHRRLGHINHAALRLAQKSGAVLGLPDLDERDYDGADEVCPGCVQAKHRRELPHNDGAPATSPLHAVHADLAGPFPASVPDNYTYVVVFVDGFTRYIAAFPLRDKSAASVAAAYKLFRLRAETQHNTRIRFVRTDGGSEFKAEFAQAVADGGAVQETSAPETPEQNGMAERAIRTVKEGTFAMLHDQGLPHTFWPDAMRTFVDIRNRIKVLKVKTPGQKERVTTPYEMVTGRRADVSMFRLFGTPCWPHIPAETRTAGEPKTTTEPCIYLGPHHTSMGHRVWSPAEGKMRYPAFVQFMEYGAVTGPRTAAKGNMIPIAQALNPPLGQQPRFVQPAAPTPPPAQPALPALPAPPGPAAGPAAAPHQPEAPPQRVPASQQPQIHNFAPVQLAAAPAKPPSAKAKAAADKADRQQAAIDAALSRERENKQMHWGPAPTAPPKFHLETKNRFEVLPQVVDTQILLDLPGTFKGSSRKTATGGSAPKARREHTSPPTPLPPFGVQVAPPPIGGSRQVSAAATGKQPTHPYMTRSRGIDSPATVEANATDIHSEPSDEAIDRQFAFLTKHLENGKLDGVALDAPPSFKRAWESPLWRPAIDDEINKLQSLGTFSIVPRTRDMQVLRGKWVLVQKTNADGTPGKRKARYVARGDMQTEGVSFSETYAPTSRYDSIRLTVAIAVAFGLFLEEADIDAAYLNAPLIDEVYMYPVPGYPLPTGTSPSDVFKLNKSLYGLRQAGREWHAHLHKRLIELGYRPLETATCMYVRWESGEQTIIVVFVDDLLIASNKRDNIKKIKDGLRQHYGVKDRGDGTVAQILGINIDIDRKSRVAYLSQRGHIDALIKSAGMEQAYTKSTPIDPTTSLDKEGGRAGGEATFSETETTLYRSLVGQLIHISRCTRPDIAFAVGVVSRYNQDPSNRHMTAVKDIIRYLKGTIDLKLRVGGCPTSDSGGPPSQGMQVSGFSDSDYAAEKDGRRCTTGYVMKVGDSVISWSSKLQSTPALSTTESEYMGLCAAAREGQYLRMLLDDIGIGVDGPTLLYGDNQGSLALLKNPSHHERTKHIDVQFHYLRHLVNTGALSASYVQTDDMVADIFTKALCKGKFERDRERIGVTFC